MLTCNVMGGLGNQLFQIVTTIALAFRIKHKFIFLYKKVLDSSENVTVRNTYWDTLLVGFKPFTKQDYPLQPFVVRENGFKYQDINIPYTPDPNNTLYMLYGYYQSYKYFDDFYDMIFNKFMKINNIKETVKNKYSYDYENSISMHFRIGDYVNLQHMHPIMKYGYYTEALEYIIKDKKSECKNILYFCEEKDLEEVTKIVSKLENEYVKSNIGLKFICVNFESNDWEQLIMMSLCKHNIIANSTFSWWGAYLNSNKDKIVCYPETWFGKASTHDVSDLFPPEWKKIDC